MAHDRLARIGIIAAALYLIALPLGHTAALRAFSLAIALAVALVLWWRHDRQAWPPLLPMFGVWLTVALFSLWSSVDPENSLGSIWGEILRSFLVCFVFHTLTRRTDALAAWGKATAGGAIILSVLAVASLARHGQWIPGYLPPLGDFSTVAITLLPLLVLHALRPANPPWMRALMALAILATSVGAYLTHSRGFWLSLICALIALTLAAALGGRQLRPRSWLYLALACAIALALAAQVSGSKDIALAKFDDRAPIYAAVTEKIRHNPPTGTGYGHETDRAWYQTVPGLVPNVYHAHNLVLSYLDQMGPGGLLVLALIFGAPLAAFARALRRQPGHPLALAGVALLAAIFVKNNLDFFFCRANLLLFFAHLGIYLGQLQREADQSGQDQPMPASSSAMRCA